MRAAAPPLPFAGGRHPAVVGWCGESLLSLAAMAATDKYDRQLRLWGANGQRALMRSRICLLNAGPTGTETLKNLVLPGCGFAYVVDDGITTARDCENSFFVTRDHIGQPRAKVVLDLLLEMNEDVKGDYRVASAAALVRSEPSFFHQFSLVVATQLTGSEAQELAAVLQPANIPLVLVRSYGLVGYMRVVTGEHTVTELKPFSSLDDLRIGCPFPALRAMTDGVHMDALDDMAHKHVPYIILLIKALDAWKATHGGAAPKTFAEKAAFRASVVAGRRSEMEDNYDEALDRCHLAFMPSSVDDDLRAVLDDERATMLAADTPHFWFIVRAIRDFVAETGEVPLSGELPDMTATTDLYVTLQRLYVAKAAEDAANVVDRVATLCTSVGLAGDTIPAREVQLACKNARFLRVFRFHSLAAEYGLDTITKQALASEFENVTAGMRHGCQSAILWYVMFRSVDAFHDIHHRLPGDTEATMKEDEAELLSLACRFVARAELPVDAAAMVTDKHAAEMVRFGGSELHTVAALMGGVAAQEVVKLLTHQYEVLDNTFIFNGINSASGSFAL